jgi:hypothetical protein
MTWTTTIAGIFGVICMQFIPLPKWTFLLSLTALGLIIIGVDLIAVLQMTSSPNKPFLLAGALIGVGIGYFLKWFRLSLTINDQPSFLIKPKYKNSTNPATSLAGKITQLGGLLADPASVEDIEKVETRLGITLPFELRTFLIQHDGTTQMSDIGMWSFWSCLEITNYTQHTGKKHFSAFGNEPNQNIQLLGDRLILFADAMMHAPVYGIYVAPGETYHGCIFELICGSISAHSFKDWTNLFINGGEDGLIH